MTMDKDGNYHKGIGKYLKQAEKWRNKAAESRHKAR